MQVKNVLLASAIALALAAPLAANAKKPESKTFPIAAQNGSGEKGTVTLTADGAKTTVVVALSGAPAEAQPAHIHTGTCANLNPAPKYPLTSLASGKSTTTIDEPIADLVGGGFAVNVHKSANDLKDYVACGDLASSSGMMAPKMMMSPKAMMPAATSSP